MCSWTEAGLGLRWPLGLIEVKAMFRGTRKKRLWSAIVVLVHTIFEVK
jgi:hypothetical protein